ncbi:MAG: enoyl-CoA hydratase/isomerase family protein [Rhodospirillales bacterium CG15_BIG_FIL_POST_REV_8_21_14_020_66_15]|nr:MAG: enoyl-CoA hydratase/isomerase family protein [Rhodospirillales bacterium CG15_BIG_FIL_POST_REV_8_21_14_020_66_15]
MTDHLIITTTAGATEITLNRADRANALGPGLVEGLLGAVDAATWDGTRLLVLRGEGKSFCSGFDLSDLEDVSDGDLVHRLIRIETLLQAVYHAPFPTLALAHGRVFGAGADLFCACSRRIAAPGTAFRMPGLGFGIVLGTRRLQVRVGEDQARRIQNSGLTFGAAEALDLGFATEIAEPAAWPALIDAERAAAHTLTPQATADLFRVTATDTRDADMADIARTASVPGLRARIAAYREQALKAAGKK